MNATRLYDTKDMSHEEWLEARKGGIGGSEAATVCGVNPWTSPVQLWMEKTRRADPPDLSDNEAVYWGTMLEDKVAIRFSELTGKKVMRQNAILQSADNPFMFANVDRVVVGENAGLECKTTSVWNRNEWADEGVPDHYKLQCQHYIAVTGWDVCYIAVLIGGQHFEWRRIERDQSLIDRLVEQERRFWEDHVLADVPPEIFTIRDVEALFGSECSNVYLEPDMDSVTAAREYLRLQEQARSIKKDMDGIKESLIVKIQDRMGIEGVCTYKAPAPSVDWEAMAQDQLEPNEIADLRPAYLKKSSRRFVVKLAKEYR